ncbi:hypothetical protein AB7W30_20305 [Providencia manganoxydans]|uniref:hypothetical protein n=1 Tax=Providencia manganoxydans TaxID=2923283 RepID=UPI0032DB7430
MMNAKETKPVLEYDMVNFFDGHINVSTAQQIMAQIWGGVDLIEDEIINIRGIHQEWLELANQILSKTNNSPYFDNYLSTLNDMFNDSIQSYNEIYNSMNAVMFSYNDVLNLMIPVSDDIGCDIRCYMSILEKRLLVETSKSYEAIENNDYMGSLFHQLTKKTNELLSAFRDTKDIAHKVVPKILSFYKSHVKPQLLNDASALMNDLVNGDFAAIATTLTHRVENTLEDMQFWVESAPILKTDQQSVGTEIISSIENRMIDAVSCFGAGVDGSGINTENLMINDKAVNPLSMSAPCRGIVSIV